MGYGALGLFLPFGLVNPVEMYVFGIVFGLNFGSTYSYARSVFSGIVPPGQEAEFFALFEITDKGSSWIGPIMTAVIANSLSIRWAMVYVVIFFLLPMPILIYGVDLDVARQQAGRADQGDADANDKAEDVQLHDMRTSTGIIPAPDDGLLPVTSASVVSADPDAFQE